MLDPTCRTWDAFVLVEPSYASGQGGSVAEGARNMPERQLQPCRQPGCPHLVPSGYCPEHARAADRLRGTPAERGYDAHWQKVRARYLRWHQWCSVPGCSRKATDVDHIVRRKLLLERGIAHPDADEHLQSLCHKHHSEKTARETGFGGSHA